MSLLYSVESGAFGTAGIPSLTDGLAAWLQPDRTIAILSFDNGLSNVNG